MKNSTKYIIFGGLIALVGGTYYFVFHKGSKTEVKQPKKDIKITLEKPNIKANIGGRLNA